MLLCPNMRLIMVSQWKGDPKHLDLIHVRCKQWNCPYCAPVNSRIWRNYILTRLSRSDFRGRSWVLITITAHENAHKAGPLYTILNLQRGFRKMYHRLKRYNGGDFEYLRVFELHPNGKYKGFHMHIIAAMGDTYGAKKEEFAKVLERERRARKQGKKPRKRLKRERHPSRWIKDTCKTLGMGVQADIRQIGSVVQKTAAYMTKYISKQLEINEFPPRVRRIQASRRFGSPRVKDTGNVLDWRPKSAIFREDLQTYTRIVDLTLKRVVTLEDDFANGELWYPKDLN